jgi:prolipoprotein diacylglyceryltransferase
MSTAGFWSAAAGAGTGRGDETWRALASVPSPARAAWRLGPLSVRAYALCIVAGIVVAVIVARRRYRLAGGRPGVVLDVAAWAVPFGAAGAVVHAGLVAARHDFTGTLRLWHAATAAAGAIGVPGAVALGAAGAWVACRRAGARLGPVAGAAAPAVLLGLAVAGLGNWWTQQCYGPPSAWWWAVRISPEHRVPGYENYATFQPVFAYQSLWDAAVGLAVIIAGRRLALDGQRVLWLAAAGYAAGGLWAESARIGPLPHALGVPYGTLRDTAVLALALISLYLARRGRSGRPALPSRAGRKPGPAAVAGDSSGDVMSR